MGTTTFECPVCCGRVEASEAADQATCPHCHQPVPTPSLQAGETRARQALAALEEQHVQAIAKPSLLTGTQMICPHCGSTGRPRTAYRGSSLTTLLLALIGGVGAFFAWPLGLMFGLGFAVLLLCVAPALVYAMWRMTTKHKACRTCRQPGMIPLDTPMGRKLREQVQ